MTKKTCYVCGEEKSLDEFHRHRGRKDGHADSCKPCRGKIVSLYANTDGAKVARAKFWAEYKEREKEKLQDYHRDYQRNMTDDQKRDRDARSLRRRRATPRQNLYAMLYSAAKRRPTENVATLDDLVEMYEGQKGLCAVSGMKMEWAAGCTGKKLATSISLDRIDNDKGYEIENIRLVCWQVNVFKNNWTDEQMISMARAIVDKAKSSQPTWNNFSYHHFDEAAACH